MLTNNDGVFNIKTAGDAVEALKKIDKNLPLNAVGSSPVFIGIMRDESGKPKNVRIDFHDT